MSFFTRKGPLPEPTPAELHELALFQADRAVSIFQHVVDDLRSAGDKHVSVGLQVEVEIERLSELKSSAVEAARDAYAKATSIAGLL